MDDMDGRRSAPSSMTLPLALKPTPRAFQNSNSSGRASDRVLK